MVLFLKNLGPYTHGRGFAINIIFGGIPMRWIAWSCVLVLVLVPALCLAQSGAGAIGLQFNTSARFEAMGGAGVASPWGPSSGNSTNH